MFLFCHPLKGGNVMKVVIGSVLVVIMLVFGLWLSLSPSFKRVGKKTTDFKNKVFNDDN